MSFFAEINRVRNELFHCSSNGVTTETVEEIELPPVHGPKVKLTEKVFAPVEEYPKVCESFFSLLCSFVHQFYT